MAGRITGIEPLELPGAYRATYADGSSMLIHGDPAKQALERFKPAEATSPAALASNDAGMSIPQENMSRADAAPIGPPAPTPPSGPVTPKKLEGGGVSIPLSAARAITRGEKVLEAPPAPAQAAEAAPGGQAAAAQPQAAAPAQAQAGPLGYTMKGIDPATGKEVQGAAVKDSQGNIGILLPGSRGTAGGLTTLGKEKLAHDAATEVEVAHQRQLEMQARETGVDAAKQEADQRAGYLDEAKVQAQLAIQQQQDEQAKIQQHVDKLQGAYDKARDDFLGSKVDPDEYMKRGHGAVGIFSAIGVAMSQFGGAFTGQPNVAAAFVNNQIDRSIRAQEAQINVKGKAADNMLADLTRETGSLSSAKLAMKQMLTEKAAIELQSIGSGTKSQQIAALNNETAAKLAQQNALLDNDRRQKNTEEAFANPLYYRKGTAGSAPRIALPTQEAAAKGQQMGIDLAKLKLEQERQKANGNGDKVSPRAAAVISTARVARGAIQEMADSIGAERDESGKFKEPSFWSTVDAKIPYSDTRQKINALKGTLEAEVGKAQTGGVLTESSAHEMREQIKGLSTPGEYAAFLNHYDHTMAEVEKQVRTVAGSVHEVGTEDTQGAPQ